MTATAPITRGRQCDTAEIVRACGLIFEPGQVTELRALEATVGGDRFAQTYSGYFNDWDKLATAAAAIQTAGNIYIIPNPVNPGLLARRVNKIGPAKKSPLTSDKDIVRRRWLLIDCDPIRPAGIASTDAEHKAAIDRAHAVAEYLRSRGWPGPIVGDSGNGGHLMYRIDEPDADDGLIEKCLAALQDLAGDAGDTGVQVDVTCSNPARLWKLYGTLSGKGDADAAAIGRPQRMARILEAPEKPEVVPHDLLVELAAEAPKPAEPATGQHNGKAFDLAGWIRNHKLPVKEPEPWQGGTRWVFPVCPFNADHANGSAVIVQGSGGKIGFRCHHNGCRGNDWHKLREMFEPDAYRHRGNGAARRSNGQHRTDDVEQSTDGRTPDPFSGPPIPLEPAKPPALESGIFPGVIGEMIDAATDALEVPRELPAVFALASLAIAGQGRWSVRPERDYFEPLPFWSACGLPSGSRKSEAMRQMMQWAWDWQREKAAALAAEIKQATADDAILTGRIKALRQKAAKVKDETEFALLKSQADALEKDRKLIPVAPRILAEDITAEHLGTMMSLHGGRMGIISDESGPLDNWGGRYYTGGGANIDLALKGYSGMFCAVDRGSRPTILLTRPLLTIGLSPQPSVIAALASNEVYRRRGLPGRVWFFMPVSPLGFRQLNGDPIPDETKEQYKRRLVELLETPTAPDGYPRALSFSPDAWRMWKDFALEIERMMQPDKALERMTDWAGKLPGGVARVAALFHLAIHGSDAIRVDEIAADSMTRAIALARVAIEHAKVVFEGMDATGTLEAAKRVLRQAQNPKARQDRRERYGDPSIVSLRDLWNPNRGTYASVAEFDEVLGCLLDHNCLAELPNSECGKPGRPSRRFRIHPALEAE
jgi:hypothetical protein